MVQNNIDIVRCICFQKSYVFLNILINRNMSLCISYNNLFHYYSPINHFQPLLQTAYLYNDIIKSNKVLRFGDLSALFHLPSR